MIITLDVFIIAFASFSIFLDAYRCKMEFPRINGHVCAMSWMSNIILPLKFTFAVSVSFKISKSAEIFNFEMNFFLFFQDAKLPTEGELPIRVLWIS